MGAASQLLQQVHAKAGPPRGVTTRGPMPLPPLKLLTTVLVAMALVRALAATWLKRFSRPLGGSVVFALRLATAVAIRPHEHFSYTIGVRRSLR